MLTGEGSFQRAAVIGAGLMGRRIAGVLARGGLDVAVFDVQAGTALAGASEARAMAASSATAGTVRAAASLGDAVAGADLMVEAVIENLKVKRDLVTDISRLSSAVIATNTSVLPVTAIAEAAVDPSRVVGTHWWNPPDLIPIVEVVLGAQTDPALADGVVHLLTQLRKLPVLVRKDVPGFIGNRLQHALWREALALVVDGVCAAETVDLVVRNTIGLRLAEMGPLENADYVGLDLTVAIHDAVLPSLDRSVQASPLLEALVATGELGAKTGQGLLAWPAGRREQRAQELAAHISNQLTRT